MGRSLVSLLKQRWRWLIRAIGLFLLGWLLLRIDTRGLLKTLGTVDIGFTVLAAILLIPLIVIKAFRWLLLMGSNVRWRWYYEATLSYFSGLFLGFLTPGRLGEFVRIFYARRRLQGDTATATISVLADRIFDLAALLLFGGAAILTLPVDFGLSKAVGWLFIAVAFFIPLVLLLVSSTSWLSRWLNGREWSIGRIRLDAWFGSLLQLNPMAVLAGIALTMVAYALFFGQGTLLALALRLPLNYLQVAFTLSLASLIALLPISVSGLGTREWVITLYLGSKGIPPEQALAFSALIFLTFNLWGSLLGALSWMVYPEGLKVTSDQSFAADTDSDPSPVDSLERVDRLDRWT